MYPDIDLSSLHSDRRSSSEDSTSAGSPVSPSASNPLTSRNSLCDVNASGSPTHPPRTIVFIDVLPAWHDSSAVDILTDALLPQHSPPTSPRKSDIADGQQNVFRPSIHPRSLLIIDPTVTFESASVIDACSLSTVVVDDVIVHSEITELAIVNGRREKSDSLLYSTILVPGYWKTICESMGVLDFLFEDTTVND